ncbi:pyridoxal phosphate-dependent aminotransferase [Plectonema radiosum NIES-515]|uniref:Aminotransferase n=1 Tax=Plectonema radiosum NIES-515 TaxID=2986073 RepID=A0ABT3AVC3_9CYAN|nr:pyridoxal phosphate-dependent aminotransferase [Plectonema radiosum]MCV3213050.1 pyridoxal phosphate-dependent aminotransferase [Plectonema radiosum NIES-515]
MLTKNITHLGLEADKVLELFAQQANCGVEPIDFCLGISSFNPFDYVDVPLTRPDLRAHTRYGEFNGQLSLRKAICNYYQEKFNYDLSPARVCITDGAMGALNAIFAMFAEPDGEIILAEAHFPPYRILAQIFGLHCRFAPLNDKYCVDVEQLPRLITSKTKAIIINSPSNPHGAVLSVQELEAIASLGVPVIFDEVYQALGFTNQPVESAISFSDRHFIINSFSKSLAIAGFRVGYLITPPEYIPLILDVKATLNISTNLLGQILSETLLNSWDDLIEKHRAMLTQNWLLFKEVSSRLGLKLLLEPQASFFANIDISEIGQNSAHFAVNLVRDVVVSTMPSIDFQKPDPGFLRLNFACPTTYIEPGLQRISTYLKEHCQ